MSLINQMLQDLEQRSVGNLAGANMHNQIRAVPERKRVHPAWWLVLLLSLVLIGIGVWFWLRPVPAVAPTANLALKIDSGLNSLPSPVAQSPLPVEPAPQAAPATTVQLEPAPAPVEKRDEPMPDTPQSRAHADNGRDVARPAETKSASESRHAVSAEPAKEQPQSTNVRTATEPVPDSTKQLTLTKQIKELTPQQLAENEFRKAGVALQAGRQSDAMAGLEQTLKLDPRHAAARQTLVGLLLQAKRNDDAVKLAQDGLALDPTQTGLAMILARVQVEQGDVHAALATLERGLPHAGARADYHAFMAALLQRDKRNKEAIEQYSIALGSTPQSGVWWMGLGISLQAENRLSDAHEAFSRAKATNTLTPELQAFVEQRLQQLR